MATGQLYIAVSNQLLRWAQDAGQLFLFKIGTTSDPDRRLRALNAGWPDQPGSGPCLNCTDWRWAERWHYRARRVANRDEARLKEVLASRWRVFDRSVDPRFASRHPDGATEVYQVRQSELPELDALAAPHGGRRNDLVDAAVLRAVARHIRSVIEPAFPAVPPEKDRPDEPGEDAWPDDDGHDGDDEDAERERERRLLVQDLASDQDDHHRGEQEGWFYDDRD